MKKNVINNDESIASFFKNGVSFPQFIQIIFNVDSIPGIKKNPKMIFHQKINNDTALQYLFYKNEKIKSINPSYETEKNQINLLKLILTLQCFPSDINDIIEKTNQILTKYDIHITKKSELINLKILTLILNSFTNGSFPISQSYDEIISNFQQNEIPFVINEESLDIQNSYIFIIQIQIIFEHFSENHDRITDSNQTQQKDKEYQQKQNIVSIQPPSQIYNQPQTPLKEIHKFSSESDVKTFSIKDRIKFYNQIASESEGNQNNLLNTKPKDVQQENLYKTSSQPNVSINKSNYQSLDNIKDILHPNIEINQNDIDEINLMNEIENNVSDDNEQDDEEFDQETDDTNEDPEQLEKEFEQFQKFMSDFSDFEEEEEENKNDDDKTNIEKDDIDENDIKNIVNNNNEENEEKEEEEEEEEEEEYQEGEEHQFQSFTQLSQNLIKLKSEYCKLVNNLKNFLNINTVYQRLHVDQSTSLEKLWNIPIENYKYNNGIVDSNSQNDKEKNKDEKDKGKDKNSKDKGKSKEDKSKDKKDKEKSKDDKSKDKEKSKDDKSKDKKDKEKNKDDKDEEKNKDDKDEEKNKDDKEKEKDDTSDIMPNDNGIDDNTIIQPKSNLYKIMKYDEQKYCWVFNESDLAKIVNNSKENPTIPLILFVNSDMNDINQISSVIRKDDLNNIPEKEISVLAFWKDSPISTGLSNHSNDLKNVDSIKEPLFLFVYVPKNKEKYKNIGTVLIQIYTFLFLICDLCIEILNHKFQNMQLLVTKEIIDLSRFILKNQQNDSNEPKIFYDKSKIAFIKLNPIKKTDENIIKKIIENEFLLEDINNVKEFLNLLENISFLQCYQYSDLVSTLIQVNSKLSQVSSLYLYMRNAKDNYTLMKEILAKQLKLMNLEPKTQIDNSVIDKLKQDSYHYFIKNDEYVSKFFDIAILDMTIEFNLVDNEKVKTKLNEQSQKNLEYIKKKINEKLFWEPNQLMNFVKSHMNFLEIQYFEILKNIGEAKKFDILYEQNYHILVSQKKNDDGQLGKIFAYFWDNIKKRNRVINEKFNASAKKGTNYVMKEVESLREIEVICEKGGDIDTLIEPDF